MKGVFSSSPQVDLADKLMSRLPQLRVESGANLTVVHEFIPNKKILSIPNDATAHIRGSRINVLIIADWENKDTDILDKVRKASSELGQIIIQGEKIIPESLNVGYGNYSKHHMGYRRNSCSSTFRSGRNRIGCRELWFQSQFPGPLRRKLRQTSEAETGV